MPIDKLKDILQETKLEVSQEDLRYTISLSKQSPLSIIEDQDKTTF